MPRRKKRDDAELVEEPFSPNEWMSAQDLLEELEHDPVHRRLRERREADRRDAIAKDQQDARPVLEELRDLGYEIDWFDDDQLDRGMTPDAVDVLLRWLPRVKNEHVRDGIVRALTDPVARPAAALPLIREFKADSGEAFGVRWTIGNALEVVADDSVFEGLAEILRDRRYGRDREMAVLALGNMKTPQARTLAVELLDDPDVAPYAVIVVGELRASEAESRLKEFLDHPMPWVRREARSALSKIARAATKG